MNVPKHLVAMALLLPIAATVDAATPAHPVKAALGKHMRELCTQLQHDGWTGPSDPRDSSRKEPAEFEIPGAMYYCNLEHPLHGAGPGHSPLLQALMSDSGDGPGLIFSAEFWCAADRDKALTALAEQIEKQLAAISMQAPAPILVATRSAAASDISENGLHFKTTPIDVDAQACSKVPEQGLGAVLMKIEVVIEPLGKAHRD